MGPLQLKLGVWSAMAFWMKKAISALAIAVLVGMALLGVGCGGGDDSGSERAVEWAVDPPVGPNWIRISAVIEGCPDQPLVEAPIIEYEGDRIYIELRRNPKDEKGLCFLNVKQAFKKITFERNLDELVIFDSSTEPPEQRWPTEGPLPGE
ncbi:MAG TPA: hypothetical protein VFY04_01660 [Solirubrobacterales bacterium]|nr:hypothetical protein [Solirubrobacterales bacterium]